jgi:hypothetical protein
MEPLLPPKTVKVYQLIKQTGVTLSYVTGGSPLLGGFGFYLTLIDAEHNRTLEILKEITPGTIKPIFHVFELELPNPAYRE